MAELFKSKIHRKCDDNEAYFYDACECFKLVFTFVITSEIDLFSNKTLFQNSIQEWKKLNPLLNCEILSLSNDSNNRYFAFVEDESQIENVLFLQYKIAFEEKTPEKITEAIWKLVSEREANSPFDYKQRLLWKILICRLSNNTKDYHLFFIVNHAIADGRSVYYSFIDLFQIIQGFYEKNFIHKEKIEHKCIPDVDSKNLSLKEKQKISNKKCPEFINVVKATLESKYDTYLSDLLGNIDLNSAILTDNNKIYITLKNLIDDSKNFHTKLSTFVFENEKLDKLLMKCRKENVKLNGCLNMVSIIAMKILYHKMNEENSIPIYYMNAVSLNREPMKNINSLGFKVNNLLFEFDVDLGENFLNEWYDKFWDLSRVESNKMHEMIKNGDHYRSIDYSNIPTGNNFSNHFFLTNIGKMEPLDGEDKNRLIKINQRFAQLNFSKDSRWRLFYIHVLTVKNSLNFSIITNSHFVSVSQKKIFIENFQAILNRIIE